MGKFGSSHRGGRSLMHQAICSECGRKCEVPFKPTGDKPVYCSDCFARKDGGNSKFDRRPSKRPSFGEKKMFKAICDECGQECEVPFKPSNDKPIYCNNCFGKDGNKGSKPVSSQNDKQFELLNQKLDAIIELLSGKKSSVKTVAKKEEAKPVVKEKTVEAPVSKKAKASSKVVKKETKKVAAKKTTKKTAVKKKK